MVAFLRLEPRPGTHFHRFKFPTRSLSNCRPYDTKKPAFVDPPEKLRIRAASNNAGFGGMVSDKPSICTADELHYVPLPKAPWRLALWRYKPSSRGIKRNHPLLLLSGVGTNAIGYDLAPGSSFARYMSLQGFDTWILELRGAGLSIKDESQQSINSNAFAISKSSFVKEKGTEAVSISNDFLSRDKLKVTFNHISEGLSDLLSEGLQSAKLNSAIASQVRDWSQKLANVIAEGQRSVGFRDGFSSPMDDLWKQLKYDWDFDHYLEEDVPTALDYVRKQSKPKDDKLLAVGHSMGGILLYAMLSQNGSRPREDSQFASIVTLGSSLDYTTSRSSLKLLLPLVDPAQALNIPVVPLGAMLTAAYPLASRPPYILSWLRPQISAQNMMHPEMVEKLVLNNFGTIPARLLLQLTTVFQNGGLCNRNRTFFYKDHLHKSKVPVFAVAGDLDLICPPEAVYETVKLIPEDLATYRVFGEPSGPHYGHYDIVGGRLASYQVYPCIVKFLQDHDSV